MIEHGKFLYKLGSATLGAAGIFSQVTSPAYSLECVPLSEIPMGTTINIAGEDINLPSMGLRVRALLGTFHRPPDSEPCVENPVYMLKKGYRIAPYVLVRLDTGEIIYEQTENQDEPFAPLKEVLVNFDDSDS